MDLYYKSTRNSDLRVTASKAILTGLSPDGGLFVPESVPALGVSLSGLKGLVSMMMDEDMRAVTGMSCEQYRKSRDGGNNE